MILQVSNPISAVRPNPARDANAPLRKLIYRSIWIYGYDSAIMVLAALAQSTRLDVFRLLINTEPTGLPAGEIAQQLGVPQNTMSTHLGVLAQAGLVQSERHSRTIIYRAKIDGVRDLTLFLLKDCCGGSQELCGPLVALSWAA